MIFLTLLTMVARICVTGITENKDLWLLQESPSKEGSGMWVKAIRMGALSMA